MPAALTSILGGSERPFFAIYILRSFCAIQDEFIQKIRLTRVIIGVGWRPIVGLSSPLLILLIANPGLAARLVQTYMSSSEDEVGPRAWDMIPGRPRLHGQ